MVYTHEFQQNDRISQRPKLFLGSVSSTLVISLLEISLEVETVAFTIWTVCRPLTRDVFGDELVDGPVIHNILRGFWHLLIVDLTFNTAAINDNSNIRNGSRRLARGARKNNLSLTLFDQRMNGLELILRGVLGELTNFSSGFVVLLVLLLLLDKLGTRLDMLVAGQEDDDGAFLIARAF